MRVMQWVALPLVVGTLAAADDTVTDSAYKYVWAENVGWANASPTNVGQTVVIRFDGDSGWLSGYTWGENIGWIIMGSKGGGPYANTASNNWGVNLDASCDLSGYAYGENIGWINFGAARCDAAINPLNGEFSGHAWGENIGWLKFNGSSPDYGVRSRAFYTQPLGTPNWWLDLHRVTEDYDAGDSVPAWKKYVMDTNPNIPGDYLQIVAVPDAPVGISVALTPVSTRRYYTLMRQNNLIAGGWSNVAGQVGVQYDTGGPMNMHDPNAASHGFYRVQVKVTP